MKRDAFLESTSNKMKEMGHLPSPWTKGRWGFHTGCQNCGAFVAVCVSDQRIREFPDDTCTERLESLAKYSREMHSPEPK